MSRCQVNQATPYGATAVASKQPAPESPPLALQQQFSDCLQTDCPQKTNARRRLAKVADNQLPLDSEWLQALAGGQSAALLAPFLSTFADGDTHAVEVLPALLAEKSGLGGGEGKMASMVGYEASWINATPSELQQMRLNALQLPGSQYSDDAVFIQWGQGMQLTYTLLNGPLSGLMIHAALAAGRALHLSLSTAERSHYHYLKTQRQRLLTTAGRGSHYTVSLKVNYVEQTP